MRIQTRFIPFVGFAILALLFALWAGLVRMGWQLPSFPNLSMAHGPLMVSGFLGVLIPLERAVAIRQRWMFAVPAAASLGWVTLLFLPLLGGILLTLASFGTLLILGVMVRREPHLHTITMFAGVLAWLAGNLLWVLGLPIFQIVNLWIAFLVLTIGGERLELNRVLHPSSGQLRLFGFIAAALAAGAILSLFNLNWGTRLNGLSLLMLSFWFLRNDLARRNIHHTNPLTRYIAFCLFSGFIWLGIGGALQLSLGALYAGPYYDAGLHAVFVGFVLSMIFGHAPIIFPAILGVPIRYHPAFYAHLILLHLSLLIRLFGDLTMQVEVRRWGGFLNELAILLFLGMTIHSVVRSRNQPT
ncbi:MAG TPA: hypothetical protein VFG81_12660 [Anaerolineales bacterium]|nr:hypothetical protein [Anaerolineales bacterium]